MVSNLERIYQEICRESERVAAEHDVSPTELTNLVMEIVDVEDRHSVHHTNVKQQFETLIRNFVSRLESRQDPEHGVEPEGDVSRSRENDR